MARYILFALAYSLGFGGCTFKVQPVSSGGADTPDDTADAGEPVVDADMRGPGIDRPAIERPAIVVEEVDAAGPTADANCGNQPYRINAPPPNLLIVLDRSNSMNQDPQGNMNGGASSKWTLMLAAIKEVVMETEGTIKWGLKYFGDDNSCGVTANVAVPPALMSAAAISMSLDTTRAGSSTPTTRGVTAAGEYLAALNDAGAKHILLATDGQPTCGTGGNMAADDAAAIAAVASVAAMGIKTYVIGIATQAAADTTLGQMATMGGTARAATPPYYPVTTTADLVGALKEIKSSAVRTCTYPIGMPEDNADFTKTRVTVNGIDVPKDDPNGWSWDPGMTSITFNGDTCARLKDASTVTADVQILFGCKVDIL